MSLTICRDYPEHVGHEEIRKRPRHHEEEVRVPLVHAPELELLGKRLARRQGGGGGLHHGRRPLLVRLVRLGLGREVVDGRLAVVGRLLDDEEGDDEEGAAKGKLDVEEEPPRVAAVQHVSGEEGTRAAEAQRNYSSPTHPAVSTMKKPSYCVENLTQGTSVLLTCVVSYALAALVEEEDVVDQLHRQGLAHTGAEGVDDPRRHQAAVGRGLGGGDQAHAVAHEGEEHDGASPELVIHGHEQEGAWEMISLALVVKVRAHTHISISHTTLGSTGRRTEAKGQVGVANQARRGILRNPKLGGEYRDVDTGAEEGRVAEEGVQSADGEDRRLLQILPLWFRWHCQDSYVLTILRA